MYIIGKNRYRKKLAKKNAGLLVALAATLLMSVSQAINVAPAFAQAGEDDKAPNMLTKMLASSEGVAKTKMAELQSMGIPIPAVVIDRYSSAIAEKASALDSLDRSDLSSAKIHTLTAMKLFKEVTDLANEASNSQGLLPDNNIGKTTISLRLTELQNISSKLRSIVAANHLRSVTDRNFAECDAAIGLATLAVFQSNLTVAEEQIDLCKTLLDSIHAQIGLTDHSQRAKNFADNAVKRGEELIIKAQQMGLPQADIDAMENDWNNILTQLNSANDVESMIILTSQLIDTEGKVRALIQQFNQEPSQDVPVDNSPVQNDTEPADNVPANDSPTHVDPSQITEEYVRVQSHVDSLISESNAAGLAFPASDVDNMLSSIKQHIDKGENELAAQSIEQLDSYLATIHGVIQSYATSKAEIATSTESAESLKADVTSLNYLQFLPPIEASLGLLSDASSALANVAKEDSLSYNLIGATHDYFDMANGLVATANSQIDGTKASLNEFKAKIAETREQIDNAQSRANRIEESIPKIVSPIVSSVIEALNQARGLLADANASLDSGNLDQAVAQLNQASSLMDTAEQLLASLPHL